MSTTKQERDLIRIKSPRKRTYTTKLQRLYWEPSEVTLKDAMDEWAEDYSGEHDIFT